MSEKNNPAVRADRDSDKQVPGAPGDKNVVAAHPGHEPGDHHAPGTMVLVLVLLISFAIYYFANWKALADVWHVR